MHDKDFRKNKMYKLKDELISQNDFHNIEIRVGTVIFAEIFKEAKNPSFKLQIDFGEYGIRKSSAQITELYKPADLVGKQVVCVLNLPAKQIANFISECLVLGAVGDEMQIVLIQPEQIVKNGSRIA